MTYIDTIAPEDASAEVLRMYVDKHLVAGYVPNFLRAFSHSPALFAAWTTLIASVRTRFDTRRYELVTLAAARALRSSYCLLAHGTVLRREFYSAEELEQVMTDYRAAGLSATDVAMMAFAEHVVRDATTVTREEIEELRRLGITDAEIFDIASAASARCFFSKLLDALGIQADPESAALEEGLQRALTIGRPVSTEPTLRFELVSEDQTA